MKNNLESKLHTEKENLIKEIEASQKIISQIFEKNSQNRTVSEYLDISKIKHIEQQNSIFLEKLKKDSFEIAIVGLEKAGKSTLVNALIENNILPSASERCTFTSTKLEHGQNEAVVEFYTESEFNVIFMELLKEIHFPINGDLNFRNLSLDVFKRYFDSLKSENPTLWSLHNGKTDFEIEDILKYRDNLILTGDKKVFKNEQLSSNEFAEYIRGVKINGIDTDTSKPRSVKSVTIKSSKLEQLKNAIIFDVPGFDSPTKIHERQTSERLKKADAIILVTNVGDRPNITAPQLDTIRKDSDDDGIPLNEKLFVFGNKIDRANSLEEAEKNRKVLIHEAVNRYKIALEKRIFTGSALKYLQDKKVVKQEFANDFEFNNEVSLLRDELIAYYENERFALLKQKVKSNIFDLKRISKNFINQYNKSDFSTNIEENEKSLIILKTFKEIETNLKTTLSELKFKLKNDILEEKYFTKQFKKYVSQESYLPQIDESFISQVHIETDDSLTKDIPIDEINHTLRKRIHKDYLSSFVDLISQITDNKVEEIQDEIGDIFVNAIVSPSSRYYDEVAKESKKFISSLTEEVAHNSGRFFYLIERFSRDIFDILLKSPLASNDRINKYMAARAEFDYLDLYFNQGDGTLIAMILTQKDREKTVRNFQAEIDQILYNLDTYSKNIEKFKTLTENINKAKKYLEIMKDDDNNKFKTEDILKVLKSMNRSKTKEEVFNEINNDIRNLKDILDKAVVSAMNLELAFSNSTNKQIKILIDLVSSTNSKNSANFYRFLSQNIFKIKYKEFESIQSKIELAKELETIKIILENWLIEV